MLSLRTRAWKRWWTAASRQVVNVFPIARDRLDAPVSQLHGAQHVKRLVIYKVVWYNLLDGA